MLKFVLLNRINSVFFSSFILFLFVGGCVFSEGYVSDHSFYIRFDKRVNGRVANQDLSVFARQQGFISTSPPVAEIKSPRVKSFEYVLLVKAPDITLTLAGGYTEQSVGMVVQLYGPHDSNCQRVADKIYTDLKIQFERKYGLGTVSDNLASIAGATQKR